MVTKQNTESTEFTNLEKLKWWLKKFYWIILKKLSTTLTIKKNIIKESHCWDFQLSDLTCDFSSKYVYEKQAFLHPE